MFSNSRMNQFGDTQLLLEPRTMLAAGSNVDTPTLREHNFDDGNGFFEPATVEADAALADYSQGTFIPSFDQEIYEENGATRGYRGTEIRGGVGFHREGYAGWNLTIPEDYPTDRTDVIHQWFNWSGDSSTNSAWTQLMILKNDNLYLVHRPGQVRNQTLYLIAEDLPRGEQMEFKTQLLPGNEQVGLSRVWLNEVQIAAINDAVFGWGAGYGHDEDGHIAEGEGTVAMKMGMYSIDAQVGDNPADVNRSLIFDNVSNESDDAGTRGTSASLNSVDPNRDNSAADFSYTPEVVQRQVDRDTFE